MGTIKIIDNITENAKITVAVVGLTAIWTGPYLYEAFNEEATAKTEAVAEEVVAEPAQQKTPEELPALERH